MGKKPFDAAKHLEDWNACNKFLKKATEEQAAALLAAELNGACRRSYVVRIHARFNSQRVVRERKELLSKFN